MTPGISIYNSSTVKSKTRFTAENSLISAVALTCVIVSTHYDVASYVDSELEKPMRPENNETPKGVQLIYNLISKTYGDLPIIPVLPCMIFSTDDTVNYIYEGEGKKEDVFRLVSNNALKTAGVRSKYRT